MIIGESPKYFLASSIFDLRLFRRIVADTWGIPEKSPTIVREAATAPARDKKGAAAEPATAPQALVSGAYTLRWPQKNVATVPGPVCTPMVAPMGKISTLPSSLGKVSSMRRATSCASARHSDWLMKHLPE